MRDGEDFFQGRSMKRLKEERSRDSLNPGTSETPVANGDKGLENASTGKEILIFLPVNCQEKKEGFKWQN
jgi:hypothetical protein